MSAITITMINYVNIAPFRHPRRFYKNRCILYSSPVRDLSVKPSMVIGRQFNVRLSELKSQQASL